MGVERLASLNDRDLKENLDHAGEANANDSATLIQLLSGFTNIGFHSDLLDAAGPLAWIGIHSSI